MPHSIYPYILISRCCIAHSDFQKDFLLQLCWFFTTLPIFLHGECLLLCLYFTFTSCPLFCFSLITFRFQICSQFKSPTKTDCSHDPNMEGARELSVCPSIRTAWLDGMQILPPLPCQHLGSFSTKNKSSSPKSSRAELIFTGAKSAIRIFKYSSRKHLSTILGYCCCVCNGSDVMQFFIRRELHL